MRKYIPLIIALQILCISGSVEAQQNADTLSTETLYDMSLEDLMNIKVVTASKNSENLQQAPAIINVITAKEIASYGAVNLIDVLNRATALYMTGSYYFPNNLPAIRGDIQTHTTSHVLILIDGRPCRESFYGGVDLAVFHGFPVASIEKIEIVRGPGSVLYGTNAFTGVINIITKRARETHTQIQAKAGSFGTFEGALQQSAVYDHGSMNVGLQYLGQQGWDFKAVDQAGVEKTQTYGQQNIAFTMNGKYKNFTLTSFYGNTLRDVFGERPLYPSDGTFNTLNTYRGFTDLGYEHTFTDRWHTTFNTTYNAFSQRSIRDERPVHFYANDWLAEMTHYLEPLENLHVVTGVLANFVTGEGEGVDRINNVPTSFVQHYAELRWAGYIQTDYQIANKLKLIAGGQYNKTPSTAGNFVPRLGAILNVTPTFGIKGLYGQAFKSAAQSEKFTLIPGLNYGNPALKPETITTTDIQVFYQKPTYQLNLGYFHSKQENTVVRVPYLNSAVTYVNQGNLMMQGGEAEIKIIPVKALSIISSIAYQTNENDEGEQDVTAISNVMAKGGISYEGKQGLSIGLFNSFFSKPADVINSQSDLEPDRQRQVVNPIPEAFHLLSLNISADVTKMLGSRQGPSLLLNLYGENLLNEKVYNPEFSRRVINAIPANGGRGIYGGVVVKF